MINASQDIDYFIERQRSKLNKSNGKSGPATRGPPGRRQPAVAPPPVQRGPQPIENRLDFQVARILEEPSPRLPSSQSYVPPSGPSPYISARTPQPIAAPLPYLDSDRSPRFADDPQSDNRVTFFDSFGTYAEKRAQLKEDLKREYNEFIRNKEGEQRNRKSLKTTSSRSTNNRRVQFKADPTVIAPWERDGNRSARNNQSIEDGFFQQNTERSVNRSTLRIADEDENYVRAREEYILELYEQIQELEERRRLMERESGNLTSSASSKARAHYAEDLRALNDLLAERLNQRNAVDIELARILNRPPVTGGTTRLATVGLSPLNPSADIVYSGGSPTNLPANINNNTPRENNRPDRRARRPGAVGFQIGQETDKESEQAAKKRYQQELQEQIREAQIRKIQEKQKQLEYDKKLEDEIKRYEYFGRSGGGAPMRDRDGNVVANLADLRNPPEVSQTRSQTYTVLDDKFYSSGTTNGLGSTTNPPYLGGQDQYSPRTNRPSSPNHTRGAVSNGIFGTIKTEEQLMREEKYKQDLKRQIDEKRQREIEEVVRRRAEDEREIAKHTEWQRQVEKQTAEDAARKQEKEAQERLYQQQQEEERERQRQMDEAKRRSKREERPRSLKNEDDHEEDRPRSTDEPPKESAYRSSSPPVPTIKNRGKKKKSNPTPVATQEEEEPPLDPPAESPPLSYTNERKNSMPTIPDAENASQGSSRRKPVEVKPAETVQTRKKPPTSYRPPKPVRTYSMTSLRSDGSDSELLNRLEQLKRQLKDKEARLQQQAHRQRAEAAILSDIEEKSTVHYLPPTSPASQRRPSIEYILKPTRRYSPTNSERLLRILQNEDDDEFKPSYFRDDSILMRGTGYVSPSKRVDLVDGMFVTNTDEPIRRRRYDMNTLDRYDRENPTSLASLELNRIAEKNELRLKKLRDLETDDTSMLDNNEVLERFQQRQRLRQRGSLQTLQDDAWLR